MYYSPYLPFSNSPKIFTIINATQLRFLKRLVIVNDLNLTDCREKIRDCITQLYRATLTQVAKLDNKLHARFLLNEHCEPHFLTHESKLHNIIDDMS